MTLGLTDLAVAALATWQAVEVWRHSSLTAGLRARTELWEGKAGELLRCPFCLSVWVGLLAVGALAIKPEAPDLTAGTWVAAASIAVVTAMNAFGVVFTCLVVVPAVTRDVFRGQNRRSATYLLASSVVAVPAAVWLLVLMWAVSPITAAGAGYVLATAPHAVLWGLAAARLANLGNDLSYEHCRTPNKSAFAESAPEAEPKPEPEPEPDPARKKFNEGIWFMGDARLIGLFETMCKAAGFRPLTPEEAAAREARQAEEAAPKTDPGWLGAFKMKAAAEARERADAEARKAKEKTDDA